jgi:hypothetical protein
VKKRTREATSATPLPVDPERAVTADPMGDALHLLASARGVLVDLGARGDARAAEGAQLVGALYDALCSDGRAELATAVRSAALSLRYAVDRRPAAKRGALAPVARAVRDGLVTQLRSGKVPLTGPALAVALEVAARSASADAIFPRVGTAEERIARYTPVVADVLYEKSWLTTPALAQRIVVVCARADGMRGAARKLFDADAKADARRDGR